MKTRNFVFLGGVLILVITAGCILFAGIRCIQVKTQLSLLPKQCATPDTANQPINNSTPDIATIEPIVITVLPEIKLLSSNKTSNWINYQNEEYKFSFGHPNLDQNCCSIYSYTDQVSIKSIVTLADKSTGIEGTDKPFDGFNIAIDINKNDSLTLREYINKYIDKILEDPRATWWYQEVESELPQQFTEQPVTFNNHNGIILEGLTDEIFFTKLPSGMVLIFTKSEEAKGSFDSTYREILSTITFDN